jgi:hypothetical protein
MKIKSSGELFNELLVDEPHAEYCPKGAKCRCWKLRLEKALQKFHEEQEKNV